MFASQATLVMANARRYRCEQRPMADLEALTNTSLVGGVVFDASTATADHGGQAEILRFGNDQEAHTKRHKRLNSREHSGNGASKTPPQTGRHNGQSHRKGVWISMTDSSTREEMYQRNAPR